MKKITLLVASIFLAGGMAYASENPVFSDTKKMVRSPYCNEEPVRFNERGIEFFVFPNGDFDFNTRPDATIDGNYYYKGAGKRGNLDDRELANYGVCIERDYFGRIRRVGNTFINYDSFDRVNRIGTVFMRYNRFALSQIGGLRIIYDRRGNIIDMVGSVKNRYTHYNHPRNGYSPNYFYENEEYNDDNYYFRKEDSKNKNEDMNKEKKRR